jgi:hypothetical protein
MILEMRDQAAPELDWDRIEARLAREPQPEPRSALSLWLGRMRLPAAGLVAAGGIAAALLVPRPQPLTPAPAPALVAKISNKPLDGERMSAGTHLTAGDRPVVVDHAGRASWTLEPHASASVAVTGEFLTVKLTSGAVSAKVVPSPKPETFAIEVEGTRVAVHGTAFRVERVGDRVLVEVSEGTVAVEPSGTRSEPAFLLRRDSRGSFALDGRTGSVEGNASAVVREPAARSHRAVAVPEAAIEARAPQAGHAAAPSVAANKANGKARAASPVAPSSLPLQPSISDIEAGVSSAIVLLNRCFQEKTRSTGNGVSANTGLTLAVGAEGNVESVTFTPPLAPAVEECAVTGLRSLAFTPSREGVTFTRILELAR